MHIPSEELLKKSQLLYQNRETADSSFIYATVISNRYSSNISTEEKLICARANITLWYLCFTYYNDFSKAYAYILKAEDIVNEIDVELPLLDMDLGCFYDFIGEQNNDKSLKKEALIYYKKALKSSYEQKNNKVLNYSFINIFSLLMDNYQEIDYEWNLYENAEFAKDDQDYIFNSSCYKALQLAHNGLCVEAMRIIDNINLPNTYRDDEGRSKYILECLKANIYEINDDIKKAIIHMKKAETIATEYSINEMKLNAYKKNSEYFRKINDLYNHQEYRNKYLSLKDSIFGYSQISKIGKMKFLGKIDKMNVEIMEMKQKREIQNVFFIVICIILVIIACSATMLYIKNKQISKKNDTLFHNYKDMCLIEEQLRKQIKEYKDNAQIVSKNEKQKYVNSSLRIEEKDELLDKILNVMENTQEVCSSEFSSERLSELVGINYKYISQVINEKYGCSFSVLLNKYRIKEVCRRFADTSKYGNYTTEAISESVGFKNRTTFINAFKKEIGMTPYQYLKCLKQDKKNEQETKA